MACIECGQESALYIKMPITFETKKLLTEYENIKGDSICMGCLFLTGLDVLQEK